MRWRPTTRARSSPIRVLSRVDNLEATIEQGQEIPYTVASTTGIAYHVIQEGDAEPEGPHRKITPDDHVNLKVTVTDDTIGAVPAGSTVPALNTKRVDTSVQVENGGTVVLAVSTNKTNQTDIGKVPLPGDIPVMGNLFKQRKVTDTRTEMLIFITLEDHEGCTEPALIEV